MIGSKDPEFGVAHLDVDEWRDEPVRHRYVHGGFEGTDTKFSIYFPPPERYEGRFFHPVLPMSGIEHAAALGVLYGIAGSIEFAVDSGAYLVESNMGRLNPFPGEDWTLAGYRASAAVARYSRVLAAEMYGDHRPYGYVYGGSGGVAEDDLLHGEHERRVGRRGAVRHGHADGDAERLLGPGPRHAPALGRRSRRSSTPIEPGGSGDMYAGLTAEQREALAEVTRMGFPPRAWFDVERLARGYTGVWSVLADNMVQLRPDLLRGLLDRARATSGTTRRPRLREARVQHKTTVTERDLRRGGHRARPAHADGDAAGRADRGHPRRACGWPRLPDANLRGATADRRRAGPRPTGSCTSSASRATSSSPGVGEAALRGAQPARSRRRGADRQLGVPRVPDLSPPPGAPRLPGVGPVHGGRRSRSTRSGRT